MKKILFSLVILCVTMVGFANNDENKDEATNNANSATTVSAKQLTGVVTDKISNEALVGVEVKIEGSNQKVYTDFDGKFTFENLKPGEYNLEVSYISYEKSKIEHIDLKENNKVAICLQSSN